MSLTIGILGFGYLGQEIKQVLATHIGVWVTSQRATSIVQPESPSSCVIPFRWSDPETWPNLPNNESILIITIPPTSDNTKDERLHLESWCGWIRVNRPGYKRCIYISSTGVYPNQPGNWAESSHFECDNLRGELRLLTEQVLSKYFELVVIRPGAIYGKERNIGHRILEGKPVPKGKQPVHRIHVHDLARLTQKAVLANDFPIIVNAIDLESETTKNVANWLVSQSFFPSTNDIGIQYREDFQTRKFSLTQPDRRISNQLLTKTLGFSFVYPTYKEGLTHAFGQELEEKRK